MKDSTSKGMIEVKGPILVPQGDFDQAKQLQMHIGRNTRNTIPDAISCYAAGLRLAKKAMVRGGVVYMTVKYDDGEIEEEVIYTSPRKKSKAL